MSEIQNEEGNQETKPTASQFAAGEVDWDQLSEEEKAKALTDEETEEPAADDSFKRDETPAEPEEKPAEEAEPKAEETPEQTETKDDEKEEEKPESKLIPADRYHQKANELNTVLQHQRNHEQRLRNDPVYRAEWLKTLGVEQAAAQTQTTATENNEDVDVYDEGHLKGLGQRLAQLEQQNNELRQSLTARDQQEQQNRALDNTFREIETLQDETPALKTQRPFRELNELFKQAHMANNGNVTADTMAGMGVSESDFNRLNSILEIHEFKQKANYPTLRSALFDSGKLDLLSQSTVSAVTQAEAEAKARKAQEVGNQAHVVDTTASSTGVTEQGWTPDRLATYWRSNPDPNFFWNDEAKMAEYRSAQQAMGMLD